MQVKSCGKKCGKKGSDPIKTYVAKGRIRFFFGPEGNQQVIDAEAGDYIYTPVGEIHSQLNLSDTETAEYTSTYVGESDRNQLGTVFVEG
jgi:uncharacterized RmlC-like cupin family protein